MTQLLVDGKAPAAIAPWMAGGALFPGAKKGDGVRFTSVRPFGAFDRCGLGRARARVSLVERAAGP